MSDFGSYALVAAVTMLTACGGSQSQLAPLGPFQQSNAEARLGQLSGGPNRYISGAAHAGVVALHPDQGPSWMAPGAATKDLLYISNFNTETVLVYSYPDGKKMGTLTGFAQPDGLCSDKNGDVWIVNNERSQSGEDVVEYKHGGTNPIKTLKDPSEILIACSVDPTTGNLAVTNTETYSFGRGALVIWKKAKGTPTVLKVPNMMYPYFCGYDDKGNLYVDGQPYSSAGFTFAELPKGQEKFKVITLDKAIEFPGNVRWDGKYVAVGDQEYAYNSSGLYQSAIYQTTGASGKVVHVIPLEGTGDIIGFSIEGKALIGPDAQWENAGDVFFWNYPAGGKATKTLKGFDAPYGTAISVAK
jgi:hypothetical protein